MRIAICDDDAYECSHVAGLLRELGRENCGGGHQVAVFHCGADLLSAAKAAPFELYLLDIVMPELSGLDLASLLGEQQRRPNIVFLTSSREYTMEAFRVWASGYLLKPVGLDALRRALEQVPAAPAPAPPAEREALIPMVGADRLVPFSQIICVESQTHKATYSLADGTTLCTRSLRKSFAALTAPLLESPQFIQTHRAFVANLALAKSLSVSDRLLTMECGVQIPVSRTQLLAVRNRFFRRINQSE